MAPMRTRLTRPADLTERIAELEKGHDTLVGILTTMRTEIGALRDEVQTDRVAAIAEETVGARRAEVTALTDDCVAILRVLVDAGVVGQDRLNAAVARG